MDRALDEVIGDRQKETRGRGNAQRPRRDNQWPRDGARKTGGDRNNIDDDWIHDKYEDNDDGRGARRGPRGRGPRDRRSPEPDLMDQGAKIRVENLHYDLTEDDIEALFARIAPVANFVLTYDRAGRSTGTAYVTYRSIRAARDAITEYDGANANGQPIRLSLVPTGPSGNRGGGRNPFDSVVKPGRSLFDRIEGGRSTGSRGRERSRSPRRSDTTKPAPEGIDRYVPGGGSRSRTPPRRRNVDRSNDRRNDSRRGAGGRRGGGPRRGGGDGDRQVVQGRPRKTQEELDAEMDNYFAGSKADNGSAPAATAPTAAPVADDDIDMIE